MIPELDPIDELEALVREGGDAAPYAAAALRYVDSGDPSALMAVPPIPTGVVGGHLLSRVWFGLATRRSWSYPEERLARVAIDGFIRHHGSENAKSGLERLLGLFHRTMEDGSFHSDELRLLEQLEDAGIDRMDVGRILVANSHRHWGMDPPPEPGQEKPNFHSAIESWIFASSDADLASLLEHSGAGRNYVRAVARFRPEAIALWWPDQLKRDPHFLGGRWPDIISVTDHFDDECIAFAQGNPPSRFGIYSALWQVRGKCRQELEMAATAPDAAMAQDALSWLLAKLPDAVPAAITGAVNSGCIRKDYSTYRYEPYLSAYRNAITRWDQGGREMFESLRKVDSVSLETAALNALLNSPPAGDDWPALVMNWTADRKAELILALWTEIVNWISKMPDGVPEIFREALVDLLGNRSSQLRNLAVDALASAPYSRAREVADAWMENGTVDQKLGAIALLARTDLGGVERLRSALSSETREKVRQALHTAIKDCGGGIDAVPSPSGKADSGLTEIENAALKMKLPKTGLHNLSNLPDLLAKDGAVMSGQVVTYLIAKQSKHKHVEAAPDIQPLLSHIDREKSPPFALALVEGFLNSDQAASDRWALALGGLLGDSRIIPPLLSRIPDWCDNSGHKLAEYAAQAIALLPGNEPLMVLDSLSNRYRSKFKNVGKACAEAFNAAAAARGITADELGDMVVPDFGFDGDGIRRFEWDGGGASAELGADFKLSWFDPDTDKAWKSLPANAPAAVKDEVKTLGKLLREAVKAQTARLEMTLVRQRRWPVARWRELFENHPLLRSFASSLVWGIHDASGTLLRTFRRYPNGLLANATGQLEELPEAGTLIGMVHPLELETAALDAWRAHLGRFKVKQPFPQIDRPVELMDPLHGNRREIALTKGGKVSAGTFRSRSEKRGWTRGSVVDAGGISSYYKLYPGAGVEVVLPTDHFYVGIDPMDTVELGAAYFAKADSVERGSYTYDEPAPDDPRVLRFDQVPAVVWSETMSDLKAILGT